MFSPPPTSSLPPPTKPRYCIPEVVRAVRDMPRIPYHRILHEFHAENPRPFSPIGPVISSRSKKPFLKGISLNVFHSPVGVATSIVSLYFLSRCHPSLNAHGLYRQMADIWLIWPTKRLSLLWVSLSTPPRQYVVAS
jgi:hypothetical protein